MVLPVFELVLLFGHDYDDAVHYIWHLIPAIPHDSFGCFDLHACMQDVM